MCRDIFSTSSSKEPVLNFNSLVLVRDTNQYLRDPQVGPKNRDTFNTGFSKELALKGYSTFSPKYFSSSS
jgi:hypothetical protein